MENFLISQSNLDLCLSAIVFFSGSCPGEGALISFMHKAAPSYQQVL